ncbi:hypothetical protein SDRG_17083 [Saprolegnia diclina VS20]|uniref:Uncharacterized protein n=1 Tax=Saprolegnia diclina (strain VS20) TaxID=1156394 RepID=T0PS38_SAPDV|nr:hypothetical protein SDRG_17083 [Saprolegnia diclina VS20]EQC25036.1 hypothetical protein SDRG_17083 [Saprolegnia diclina VS20]|eukprot:XP_008621540.1 hypothetical protein SDRG_17083 [Saprolegnia diclina VS20]
MSSDTPFLATMDRGCEQFVFRALALHGWMRIGYAVVMMLNRSSAWHAAIPWLVRFVLPADAISIRGQAQIHEFIKKLDKPCLFWARRLGTYSSTNDSDRIDLMADLFRLEAFVASRDPFPDVWLSSKLSAVLAF